MAPFLRLEVGDRLGPDEVISAIGVAEMGKVYRTCDPGTTISVLTRGTDG